MEERKTFTPLELEITQIESNDVITCSGEDPNVDREGWTTPRQRAQHDYLDN